MIAVVDRGCAARVSRCSRVVVCLRWWFQVTKALKHQKGRSCFTKAICISAIVGSLVLAVVLFAMSQH